MLSPNSPLLKGPRAAERPVMRRRRQKKMESVAEHFGPTAPSPPPPLPTYTHVIRLWKDAKLSESEESRQELVRIASRLGRVAARLRESKREKQCERGGDAERRMLDAYERVVQGPLAQLLSLSGQIGAEVAEQGALVQAAFRAQSTFMATAAQSRQPSSQAALAQLLAPTSNAIQAVQEFREKHRPSPFFNHLSAVSEGIPALGWVAVTPTPAPFIKEMSDAGQFYGNRVLKEWKDKDKIHVEWVKAWTQTLTELQAFVKQYHTTGLVWNPLGAEAQPSAAPPAGGPPLPPPPPPPPPPLDLDMDSLAIDPSRNDHAALFAEINRGEAVTSGLKKVTPDMQTHKNPTLRSGPTPYKAPPPSGPKPFVPASVASAPATKTPVFKLDGKKWIVEHQVGNHNLVIEGTQMHQVVYIYGCRDSTVMVKGKGNSIVMDSCHKSSVAFDDLVSSMEFVNCQSVQMQVLGTVPTISIGKTDGCQIYLSPQSMGVEIISAKSSEMNVLVPKGDGDYVEHPIPEQFKTTVSPSGLNTIISTNIG